MLHVNPVFSLRQYGILLTSMWCYLTGTRILLTVQRRNFQFNFAQIHLLSPLWSFVVWIGGGNYKNETQTIPNKKPFMKDPIKSIPHSSWFVALSGVPIASVLASEMGFSFVICYVLSFMLVSMGCLFNFGWVLRLILMGGRVAAVACSFIVMT